MVGLSVGWLVGWLVVYLVGRLVSCLRSRPVSQLMDPDLHSRAGGSLNISAWSKVKVKVKVSLFLPTSRTIIAGVHPTCHSFFTSSLDGAE